MISAAARFQRLVGFQLRLGRLVFFSEELVRAASCAVAGSPTQLQPLRMLLSGWVPEGRWPSGGVCAPFLGLVFSPLPQLSCVSVVKDGWLLRVSTATHYSVYQTRPGCPDENQETSSKNLNLGYRR